jgi:hypothetical protein
VDPPTVVIVLALVGELSALAAFRRAGGAPRALRASDPQSVLIGLLMVGSAIVVGALVLLAR